MKRAFLPILALSIAAGSALAMTLIPTTAERIGYAVELYTWATNDLVTVFRRGFWNTPVEYLQTARGQIAGIPPDSPDAGNIDLVAFRADIEAAISNAVIKGFARDYKNATEMIDTPYFAQALYPLNHLEPILIAENKDGRFDYFIDLVEEARKTIDWILEDAGSENAFDRYKH